MKGNKVKVKDAPCEYTLWLCRCMQPGFKPSEKFYRKGRKTFGIACSKKFRHMESLGYKPNVKMFESDWSCMGVGK